MPVMTNPITGFHRLVPQLAPTVLGTVNPMTDKILGRCPECDGPVVKASGCASCPSCGWGKCG